MKTRLIAIPVHPDEESVPTSDVYIPLSGGRYVHFNGPLAPKTLDALSKTLTACKDILIAKPDDYEI